MSDLQAHFQELADDELLRAVNVDFAQYTPQALSIARAEARQRGLDVQESPEPPDADSGEPRLLRGISVNVVLALEVVTLGLYFPYWLYRNWRILADRYDEKIYPVSRAIFAPFFVHELFREIRRNSKKAGAARAWPPALLTFLFFAAWAASVVATLGAEGVPAMAFVALLLLALVLALAQIEINGTIRAHLGASPGAAQTMMAKSTAS